MTPDRMTYRQLDDLLSRLGFTRQRVEPKWLRYEHPASDTVIILVDKKPSEPVRVSSPIARRRSVSSYTISIARPPSTYDGRTRTG